MYIPIALISMVVSEYAVYNTFHSLLLVVYAHLEIVIPSEDGIYDEVLSGLIFYGFLEDIHRFLKLFLVFSLKHNRRSDGF